MSDNKLKYMPDKKSLGQKREEAFNQFAAKMDARDKVFEELKKIEDTGAEIPAKFATDAKVMLNYQAFKTFGHWRNQPRVVMKIKEAAKKAAKHAK